MTKPIAFKCPHGNHDAYFHGAGYAFCLTHGRLLYTDIPSDLHKKKAFKSDTMRIMDKERNKLEKIKKKLGKLVAKGL